jgi:hypothetical protein
MNNLIRQFERESHIALYGLGLDRVKWEAALEKFAELIVQECMSNLDLNGYDDAMMQIKEHFSLT